MFNLLSFAMYRSMSFELMCANSVRSELCCLDTYAGSIHFIFAPGFCQFVLPCQILLPSIKTVGSTIRQRKILPVKLCFINVYTLCVHNPKPTLTVMHIQYSNYVLYSRLWIEGIHLVLETNIKYFFSTY